MLDAVMTELAVALGLGTARQILRWAWPRVQERLRDFAIVDVEN